MDIIAGGLQSTVIVLLQVDLCGSQWPVIGTVLYLLWLVSIGQRCDHPDDVEVVEGSAGGEGAGQDGRLAPGNLHTALTYRHL